jgi:hypothetical protein
MVLQDYGGAQPKCCLDLNIDAHRTLWIASVMRLKFDLISQNLQTKTCKLLQSFEVMDRLRPSYISNHRRRSATAQPQTT